MAWTWQFEVIHVAMIIRLCIGKTNIARCCRLNYLAKLGVAALYNYERHQWYPKLLYARVIMASISLIAILTEL